VRISSYPKRPNLYDAIEPGNILLHAKFELPISIRFGDCMQGGSKS